LSRKESELFSHARFIQVPVVSLQSRVLKMLARKDYVIGITVSYVFLVMLYFVFQEKVSIETPCDYDQPCVRFCCKESSACKEKHIRENFNESILEVFDFYDSNETKPFFILHGKPKCSMKMIPESDTSQEWSFSYVSKVNLMALLIKTSTAL
jgi:hypothetical protein